MSSLVPLLRSLRVEEGLIEIFVREEIDDVVRRLRVPPRPCLSPVHRLTPPLGRRPPRPFLPAIG